MNATLHVTSELGKGSTFTFIFPKKVVKIPAETLDSAQVPAIHYQMNEFAKRKNRFEYTLLIVEDNVEMQGLLYQIAHPYYNVLQAEHGAAALEMLSRHQVDCIISDIMMPHMDGFEFIHILKQKQAWMQIPVIMLTARADEQDKLRALRMGIDDYMHKPFSAQELLTRIDNLIANFKNRRKYQRLENITDELLLSADQQWLQKLEQKALKVLGQNPDFTLMELAAEVNLSERHLRRKLLEITGMSANDYIREIRLQKARHLLEKNAMNTVSEISYAVGFSSVSYFSKVYGDRFGKKPSEYYI